MYPDSVACLEKRKLDNYSNKRFREFQQVLLDDEGLPDIMRTINEVKTRMENMTKPVRTKSPTSPKRKKESRNSS